MSAQSQIMHAIITLLDVEGVVLGTERLMFEVHAESNKTNFLAQVRSLQKNGHITILRSCGGRGRKTVYKRNRNQTGTKRKVTR